nr:MAG TPA: tRNA modification GTPase TrmE [Caudoviricetes sp.]
MPTSCASASGSASKGGNTMLHDHDTIVAPATPTGGAIAVVRVSGSGAIETVERIFRGRRPLSEAAGYTLHRGTISDGARLIDDVLVSLFRAPHSYTGEDSVEISCHGSAYVVSEILRLLLDAGARMATPGEFTLRAFLAGKLDLAQAEAVADLIASSSRAAHTLAAGQLRGGFSKRLDHLRGELLHLASLLELELDFSEEDVEFADRRKLRCTMEEILSEILRLRGSFALGSALKEGIPVAIVGAPNVGKSTLLNRLLNEDRAMVSEIAGTTRDLIEEQTVIDGVRFRFIDTAGIRATDDRLERMGIERTRAGIARARIVVRLVDATTLAPADSARTEAAANPPHTHSATAAGDNTAAAGTHVNAAADNIATAAISDTHNAPAAGSQSAPEGTTAATARDAHEDGATLRLPEPEFTLRPEQRLLTVVNKLDMRPGVTLPEGVIGISAKRGEGIDLLRHRLREQVDTAALEQGDTVVSNGRHYEALTAAERALEEALRGCDAMLTADLLSEEIRQVIFHLGTITGQITTDEILGNIFSKFCIGK